MFVALALVSNFDVDVDADAEADADAEGNAEEVDPNTVEEDPRFAADEDEDEAEKVDPASREGLTTGVLLLLCPGLYVLFPCNATPRPRPRPRPCPRPLVDPA